MVYLSDLPWIGTPQNGWGPVERDMSNGEAAAGDGKPITLGGATYAKGLGAHGNSDVHFALAGAYRTFTSDIGVDREVGNLGSVVFQVWTDNTVRYDSGLMTGASAAKTITLDVTGVSDLRLVVTDGGDGNASDHADWANARVSAAAAPIVLTTTATATASAPPATAVPGASATAPSQTSSATPTKTLPATSTSSATPTASVVPAGAAPSGVVYVSDLVPLAAINSWGPVERDMSNGEAGAGDGRPLTIGGTVYAKGLGVNSYSEVRYTLGGLYTSFSADLGVDAEVGSQGSVTFEVWVDGVRRYASALITGGMAPQPVTVSLAGAQQLLLLTGDGGNGNGSDHADWAGARLTTAGSAQAVSTPSPTATAGIPSTPTSGPSGSGAAPSGVAMPLGDLPGWRQVFAEDFTSSATIGSAGTPGSFQQVYGSRFGFYDDYWNMTAGCAQPARYMPSKVLQARNGVLQLALHSEVQADPFCGQGTQSYALGAAILPKVNGAVLNQLYGKYTVRFRSDTGLGGFRPAWLLWPQSEIWPRDGELDFPEGDLAGNMCGFVHYQNGTWAGDQTGVCTNVPYTGWHTASIEWSPNLVRYILDDAVVLQTTTRVPNTPMHWVMQTEACWDYCPPSSAAGNLEIDWAVMYTPAP